MCTNVGFRETLTILMCTFLGYNGNGVHRYGIFLKGVHRCGISNGGYCECSVILGLFEGVCTNLGFQGVRVHKSGIASFLRLACKQGMETVNGQ